MNGIIEAKELEFQSRFEIARLQSFWILSPHLKKSAKITDLAVFDWEKKSKKILTAEEIQEQIKQGLEIAEKIKGKVKKPVKNIV